MHDSAPTYSSSRRDFLNQTAGMAAGMTVLAGSASAEEKPAAGGILPTIKLGSNAVTRLIIGGNPIYGYSHFNKMLSQHQTAWHTPERVVELLQHVEKAGVNTWQNSYAERTLDDLERFRAAGGKLNWLCLGKGDWDERPDRVDDAAKHKPIEGPRADKRARLPAIHLVGAKPDVLRGPEGQPRECDWVQVLERLLQEMPRKGSEPGLIGNLHER